MPDHRYSAGESLSQIAADYGFADWRSIWNDAANTRLRGLRGSPGNLEPGDIIHVPDRTGREVPGSTGQAHRFRRRGVPVAAVRFIDDQGNPRRGTRVILNHLEISNIRTCPPKVRRNNQWQLPTEWLRASTDRDNFKIEVEDRGEIGRDIPANRTVLEVLKLRINRSGVPDRGPNGQLMYESFNPRRTLDVPLRRIRAVRAGSNRFRSRYLRLVTDDEDNRARRDQTLLADHDPRDLHVEILDQIVRVRYTSSSGDTLRSDIQVGNDQRRFRLRVYVMRQSVGSPDLVRAVTLDDIRRHILCWVRRTYAQVNLSPKLVSVEAIDPVENLICIYNNRRPAARGNGHITFRLTYRLNRNNRQLFTEEFRYPRTGNITRGEAPGDTAQAIARMINNRPGWNAAVSNNPPSFRGGRSSDILITRTDRTDGQVVISGDRSRDGRTRIKVGRVNPRESIRPSLNWISVGARVHRTLVRNYRRGNNDLALFVIRRFRGPVMGFAYPKSRRPARFNPIDPMDGSVFVAVGTMDRRDYYVHTADHELGHVLINMAHFSEHYRYRELMSDASPVRRNSWWISKRISNESLRYREPLPGGGSTRIRINPAQDVRRREPRYFDTWR